MKTVTVRELNRRTASVLDAVERGENFEVRRNGKSIGYLSRQPPSLEKGPNWKAHFDWLRKQKSKGVGFIQELEEERRRLRAREKALGGME